MKAVFAGLCLLSFAALACDTSQLGLSGTVSVDTCPSESAECLYAGDALYRYVSAEKDDPATFSIALQASPWRLYDGDMRIIPVDELAAIVRPKLDDGTKRVLIRGSWTGVSPSTGVPSLARQLSAKLDGFPVDGEDGFLWISPDGSGRTTRQAFTTRVGGGSYFVPKGHEVFVPLVAGWPANIEARIPDDDANLLMHAAAGWDVLMLCPDKALAGFERAASKGSAIAAYNAALMRLERNAEGDRDAALALLERGVALGDAKSKQRLQRERP